MGTKSRRGMLAARLFFAGATTQMPGSADANETPAIGLVLDLDEGSRIDPERLRASIARELGIPVVLDGHGDGGRLVVHQRGVRLVVAFESSDGRREQGSIEAPADSERAMTDIVLLAGNVARDQASAFVAHAADRADAGPGSAQPAAIAAEDMPAHEPAPERPSGGFEFGLRLGFGLPFGSSGGSRVDSDITDMVPIWIDAGYRIRSNIYTGAYYMYGFGVLPSAAQPNTGCAAPGAGCSVHDTRLGVDVQVHFSPADPLDPWAGVGTGYEWLAASWTNSGVAPFSGGLRGRNGDHDSQLSGWEFVHLEGGIDVRPSSHWAVGPLLFISLAQFDAFSSTTYSGAVDQKSIHGWVVLGARGICDIVP